MRWTRLITPSGCSSVTFSHSDPVNVLFPQNIMRELHSMRTTELQWDPVIPTMWWTGRTQSLMMKVEFIVKHGKLWSLLMCGCKLISTLTKWSDPVKLRSWKNKIKSCICFWWGIRLKIYLLTNSEAFPVKESSLHQTCPVCLSSTWRLSCRRSMGENINVFDKITDTQE